MVEWKDATSYRQGERGAISPLAWEARVGEFRIWVGCNHVAYQPSWLVKSNALGLELQLPVGEGPDYAAEAQRAALDAVRYAAIKRVSALRALIQATAGGA